MKRIKTILLFALLMVSFQLKAQRFNRLYPNESPSSFATSIVEVGDGYVTCGQKLTPTNSQLKIQKINFYGETIWESTTDDTIKVFQPLAINFYNNHFYATGTTTTSAQDQNNDGFLAKYDTDGNLVWVKQYGGAKPDAFFDVLTVSDNNLLLFGFSESYNPTFSSNFYLVKVDSSGMVLWEKTLLSQFTDRPNSICKTDDGGYLMSGYTFTPATQTVFGNYDFLVIKADSTGNELWRKKLGTDYDDNGGYVSQLRDGAYMATTSFSNSQGDKIARFIKLDPQGNTLWSKNYPSGNYSLSCSNPTENEDGTFTIAQSVKSDFDQYIVKIMKITPTGNILWQREYATRPDISQYAYNFKPTIDGGYIFCGSAFNDSVPARQEGWIVKTDCFGCDGELCDYEDSICDVYDCSLYPVNPVFSATEVNQQNQVTFSNTSANTTSRTWDFGDGSKAYYNGQTTHTYTQAGTYNVTLTVYHGVCTETSQQTITVENDYVGLGELSESNQFQIYPNPSVLNSVVHFGTAKSGLLSIVSVTGQIVESVPILNQTEIKISTSCWSSGIYIVTFENNDGVFEQQKLVISK